MAHQMNRKVAAIIGAATLLVISHQTLATTLSASATMDWDNLTIQFLPSGLNYTLESSNSNVDMYGMAGLNDFDSALDWETPISVGGVIPAVSASASANVESLNATAEMQGDIDTLRSLLVQYETSQSASVTSYADRYGSFAITGGPGLLIATVPVTVFASVTDSDGALDPFAYASASLSISNLGGVQVTSSVQRYGCFECSGVLYSGELYSDVLVAAFKVNDGDIVSLSGQAFVQLSLYNPVPAPVPLPPAVWLFGSAISAFGLLRRRMA